ncbi:MAG: MCE family protein, partial [Nitrospira sp.]|nr:MCE family protein [Nitrospira sp.]
MNNEEASMYEIKKQLMWSKLKVGLVITIALTILFLTVFFAGAIKKLFTKEVKLKAQIQNVQGLRRGAPVWISGVEVGSVRSIQLDPEHGTVVILSVEKNALEFLRKDSEASVLTMGLLGDKYVELGGGSPEAEAIKPEDMIKGNVQTGFTEIMETSATSIQKLSDFIGRMEDFIEEIERGRGTLSLLLKDPSLYENLRDTTKTLSLIAMELKEGQGTLKLLFQDPSLYNRMFAATSSFETFTRKLNEGQGTLSRLAEDPELYENLNRASRQL